MLFSAYVVASDRTAQHFGFRRNDCRQDMLGRILVEWAKCSLWLKLDLIIEASPAPNEHP